MDEVDVVLKAAGLEKLNPVQEAAVRKGFSRSLVVAAPTASGKTLIAEIAALRAVRQGRKAVYIVPLRALAQEKYDDFKRKYEPLGIKVALSIGEMDASDPWLARYDIIIATSEKLDSLLRHGIAWAQEIGLVVADEVHLLNDPDRGPTLEMVLTRLRDAKPVVLGLSATISNHQELAAWLGADAVQSDYRPVTLYRGVCYDGELRFLPDRSYRLASDRPLEELTAIDKQSLIFVSTRKGTEAAAESLGKAVGKRLKDAELRQLEQVAQAALSALEHRTQQCERLARCIRMGTAFHHAGLANSQRRLIEDSFRSGLIRIVCATPTLAAGLNLPAYRVIIRDLKRFSSYRGMDFLPVLEAQQMMGRAGRPRYDMEGEAILLPKTRAEADHCWKAYINGEAERITSKLGVEPVLRTHVLALIAGGVVRSRGGLADFFGKTFYAHQYKDMTQLAAHLDRVLGLLEGFGFVARAREPEGGDFRPAYFWEERDTPLEATRLGKRVSELYIDPLTADVLIQSMKRLQQPTTFTLLHLAASCLEMRQPVGLRKGDAQRITALLEERAAELARPPPNEWDIEYDDFLRSMKVAALLEDWTDERGEDYLLEHAGVAPGELRARLDIADWLLYAAQELALLLGRMELISAVRRARLRLRYGIREELLPLVRLKGIGRVRARRLFASGLKDLGGLRKAPLETLARIVGQSTAESIKDQLGQLNDMAEKQHVLHPADSARNFQEAGGP